VSLVVRTEVPPAIALPTRRKTVWSIEPDVVFREDAQAEEVADTTILPTRIGQRCSARLARLRSP
jgi:hypothetical protein